MLRPSAQPFPLTCQTSKPFIILPVSLLCHRTLTSELRQPCSIIEMINLNSQRFPHNYFSIYISEGLYKLLWLSLKNLGHIFSIHFCIRSITLLWGRIFNLPHFNKHISAYLENIVKKGGGYYLSVPGLIRRG